MQHKFSDTVDFISGRQAKKSSKYEAIQNKAARLITSVQYLVTSNKVTGYLNIKYRISRFIGKLNIWGIGQ